MAQAAALNEPLLQDASARRRAGYIAGPVYDTVFLIASPLVAILIFLPFRLSPGSYLPYGARGFGDSVVDGFLTTVIYSHLFIVFFRSHLNREIFRQFPFRFVAVPILLFGAMYLSLWFLVAMTVLAVWWDVYHSSMQTFGIGRIYDMKQGNDPNLGRRLDIVWNLVMYAGPILAGASLMPHVESFKAFSAVESAFFTQIPAYAETHSRPLTWGVLAFAVPFSFYYVYRYWRFHREGYKVSFQKVALYVTLGLVSVVCWGFNSFGEAFFVMNFFHALQYFFLVWWMEGKNITARFGLGGLRSGRHAALSLFVGVGILYGIWATGYFTGGAPQTRLTMSTLMLVSILHFWYDGFIWSVRRKQVA